MTMTHATACTVHANQILQSVIDARHAARRTAMAMHARLAPMPMHAAAPTPATIHLDQAGSLPGLLLRLAIYRQGALEPQRQQDPSLVYTRASAYPARRRVLARSTRCATTAPRNPASIAHCHRHLHARGSTVDEPAGSADPLPSRARLSSPACPSPARWVDPAAARTAWSGLMGRRTRRLLSRPQRPQVPQRPPVWSPTTLPCAPR